MSISTTKSGFVFSLRFLHLSALLWAVLCPAQSPGSERGRQAAADAFLAPEAETPINDLILKLSDRVDLGP
ncbi:MAG: hypothetical protein ACREX4_10725 [Gammaproteobacteria bacterium]